MKIELRQVNTHMGEQEYEMLQGILETENGFTNPAYNLSYKEYKKWLQDIDNHSRGINLPKCWIRILHTFCILTARLWDTAE